MKLRRQTRQLLAGIVVAIVLALIASGMSGLAWVAKNEADNEAKLASDSATREKIAAKLASDSATREKIAAKKETDQGFSRTQRQKRP